MLLFRIMMMMMTMMITRLCSLQQKNDKGHTGPLFLWDHRQNLFPYIGESCAKIVRKVDDFYVILLTGTELIPSSSCFLQVTLTVMSTYGELERDLFGEFRRELEHVEHVEERGQNECNHRHELDPATAERHEVMPHCRADKRHQRKHLIQVTENTTKTTGEETSTHKSAKTTPVLFVSRDFHF